MAEVRKMGPARLQALRTATVDELVAVAARTDVPIAEVRRMGQLVQRIDKRLQAGGPSDNRGRLAVERAAPSPGVRPAGLQAISAAGVAAKRRARSG